MMPKSRVSQDAVYAHGVTVLLKKIKALTAFYLARNELTFCDFGTRRRFSREWQDYVVGVLVEDMPKGQFLGTSNTYLAQKYNLLPMGTSAHEMFMVMAGIMHDSDHEIRASHNQVLREWWTRYGMGLSIALTDTYGTDFFFRDMSEEQARNWKGLRQDSGDPIAFGHSALAFYKNRKIDPKEKILIFSDGLEVPRMMHIAEHFFGKIKTSFGWGTNLTNDLGMLPLSLVIKVVEANGNGTVKISDNPAKATGKPEDIERFKRIFGTPMVLGYEECKY
jgi:nicotinate phosphoribosyltransferase